MFIEVERFHGTLPTRVVRAARVQDGAPGAKRQPRSAKSLKKAPRVFAFVDRPVFKREKPTLEDVKINGGLHAHAVVLVPKKSRLQTGLKTHVEDNAALYLGHVDAGWSHRSTERLFRTRAREAKDLMDRARFEAEAERYAGEAAEAEAGARR